MSFEEPLRHFCKDHPDELEDLAQMAFIGGSAAVMLTLFVGNAMHVLKANFVPESLVAVAFGAMLGYGVWASPYFGKRGQFDYEVDFLWFAMYLKLFALPLIIFEAGWSLRLRDFFSQLIYILIFAIVGTIVSIVVVAGLMRATAEYHGIHDAQTAWVYASLISSVDPVATLATFGNLNVDRLLFILVFGESQINDAVAITMFDAFNPLFGDRSPARLVWSTLQYLFGSILLGNSLAIVYILLLRGGRMKHSPPQEILFLTVSGIFTYQLAEVVGMSGIITVLFCSVFLGAYAGPHLSDDGILLFSFLLKQLASLCDMLIFIFVGVSAVQVTHSDLILGLWVMLFVIVSRAIAIFPLGLVCNAMKAFVGRHLPAEKRHWISWKHMVMMWHGGVCRGGVSLWMATEMHSWVDDRNGQGTRQRLINATFVLICSFLLIFGGTTASFMRWLRLPMGDEVGAEDTLYSPEDKDGWGWRLRGWWRRRVLIPLLVGRGLAADRSGGQNLDSVMRDDRSHRGAERGAEVFGLFGTDDPGHRDDINDIMQTGAGEDSDGSAAASSAGTDSEESGDDRRTFSPS